MRWLWEEFLAFAAGLTDMRPAGSGGCSGG